MHIAPGTESACLRFRGSASHARRAKLSSRLKGSEGGFMKRYLMVSVGVACLGFVSAPVWAQPVANPPVNQVNDPTGTPPGVMPLQNRNSVGFPAPNLKEG